MNELSKGWDYEELYNKYYMALAEMEEYKAEVEELKDQYKEAVELIRGLRNLAYCHHDALIYLNGIVNEYEDDGDLHLFPEYITEADKFLKDKEDNNDRA